MQIIWYWYDLCTETRIYIWSIFPSMTFRHLRCHCSLPTQHLRNRSEFFNPSLVTCRKPVFKMEVLISVATTNYFSNYLCVAYIFIKAEFLVGILTWVSYNPVSLYKAEGNCTLNSVCVVGLSASSDMTSSTLIMTKYSSMKLVDLHVLLLNS